MSTTLESSCASSEAIMWSLQHYLCSSHPQVVVVGSRGCLGARGIKLSIEDGSMVLIRVAKFIIGIPVVHIKDGRLVVRLPKPRLHYTTRVAVVDCDGPHSR
jgi:hypothetical protein